MRSPAQGSASKNALPTGSAGDQFLSKSDSASPSAWVLGASEGLGAAFAVELAARGYHVLLVARRASLLKTLAAEIDAAYGPCTETLALDLAAPNTLGMLSQRVTPDLLVYNAAMVPKGRFANADPAALRALVEVNMATPLILLNQLLKPMLERGSGDIILMSSLAGHQGAAGIAAYAASKAFTSTLAEGLWAELDQQSGVRILACDGGAIRTPGLAALGLPEAPGTMDPGAVAQRALDYLGHGPKLIPGWINKLGSIVLGRLLPRRWSIAIMAKNTRPLLLADAKQDSSNSAT